MGAFSPFSVLVGPLKVYIAPGQTAEPDVDTEPGSGWVRLAGTTGDQEIEFGGGGVTHFTDNDHQAPTGGVRGDEMTMVRFEVQSLTLESYARIISDVGKVRTGTTTAGNGIKRLPLKRGFLLTPYSLLLKGEADSPYGVYPGQYYIPLCIQQSNPTMTRSKTGRASLACEFVIYEDDNQSIGDEMGWLTVQTG